MQISGKITVIADGKTFETEFDGEDFCTVILREIVRTGKNPAEYLLALANLGAAS